MNSFYSRTEALLGKAAVEKLKNSSVALFGLGGVGSSAFEALIRSGVGKITVFDYDTVSASNFNRQLLATNDTINTPKTEAAVLRGKQINPKAKIIPKNIFYLPDTADEVDLKEFDYIIDAIDTVTAKLLLIEQAVGQNIPIISSMGTGNKLDITRLKVSDISKTTDCPLARVMRKELKKRGISHLKVVWSDEKPSAEEETKEQKGKGTAPASAIFVPAAAGLLLAKEVITDICTE